MSIEQRSLPGRALRLALAVVFCSSSIANAETERFDLLLLGGTIIDGAGAPRRTADIAIREGQIAVIGEISPDAAERVIDVTGLIVAPGFIDVHSHADRAFQDEQAAAMEGLLRQGVTTVVFGVDGFKSLDALRAEAALAEAGGSGVNFLSYIGHNSIRAAVVGQSDRHATRDELDEMRARVRDAMDFGAVGLSTGLMYLPGRYAPSEEIVALASEIAPYNGRYDSHVRDPANNLLASHRECLDIGAAAGVHAHPAHMKAVASKNFGLGLELVSLVEERLQDGQEISVDLYPYDGASTSPIINLLYPGEDPQGERLMIRVRDALAGKFDAPAELAALRDDLISYWASNAESLTVLESARQRTEDPPSGLFSWIDTVGYGSLRIVVSSNPQYEGQIVSELARREGLSSFELLRRIVVQEGDTAMVTLGAILEEDIRAILVQPWAMVASDGEELNPSHPRGRGTFPRLLGRYARDWGVLTLEEAVHKITGLPAEYLELADRGILRVGAIADITVFDPDTVIDRATWAEPTRFATGVHHVFIGGEPAVLDTELGTRRLGRFIPYSGIH